MKRRSLLACGVALTPLAAAFVGGCRSDDAVRWA